MDSKYSIVEFLRDSNSSCGYCKSEDSHHNTGMWAYTMMVEDYQALIDRGWRRSGQYCYKPIQTITCCPLYTIRCEALNLKLSKSQKKLLKKVGKYLSEGVTAKNKYAGDSGSEMEQTGCDIFNKNISKVMEQKSDQKLEGLMEVYVSANKDKVLNKSEETDLPEENETQKPVETAISENQQTPHSSEERSRNVPKPGAGKDPSKPQCKKAKLLRLEKKQKKMLEKGLSADTVSKKEQSSDKSLEDFIKEFSSENAVNKLELRLVRSYPRSREFDETYKEEHSLYQKYQMAVHNDPITKVTEQQFTRFLITSPLKVKLTKIASMTLTDLLRRSLNSL